MTSPVEDRDPREERIATLTREYREQLIRGGSLDPESLVAAHPELMPELRRELTKVRLVHQAGHVAEVIDESTFPERRAIMDGQLDGSDSSKKSSKNSAKHPSKRPASTTRISDFDPDSVQVQVPGYRITSKIDQGGQAAVYDAVQLATGRRVALKVLYGGALIPSTIRDRFEREVQVLAQLNHTGIVQILDRGTTPDGEFYLSMPYIEGIDLDDWIRRRHHAATQPPAPSPANPPSDSKPSPLPSPEKRPSSSSGRSIHRDPVETLSLFYRICDAVNAAHLRGVVHRDLKPSNIRLNANGDPVVLDFGLAKIGMDFSSSLPGSRGPATITGQFLGSLPWASPEQAEGDANKVDIRSDVYSLGVILYQMLTGRFPYDVSGSTREVMNSICLTVPIPPGRLLESTESTSRRLRLSRVAPALDPVIDAIVLKALEKSRERRYQMAGELGRDIQAFLSGQTTMAAIDQKRITPLRRRGVLVGVAVVLVCLLATTAALVHVLSESRSKTAAHADFGNGVPMGNPGTPDLKPAPGSSVNTGTPTGGIDVPASTPLPVPLGSFATASAGGVDLSKLLMSVDALVQNPATTDGLASWTIETAGHAGSLRSAAYRPDGKQIATGDVLGKICIWSADGLVLQRILMVPPESRIITHLEWSFDGQLLCAATDCLKLYVWDVQSGKLVFRHGDFQATNFSWSPDRHQIGYTDPDGCVTVWDLQGAPRRVGELHPTAIHARPSWPSGSDQPTDPQVQLTRHNLPLQYVSSCSTSPTGRFLAVAYDHQTSPQLHLFDHANQDHHYLIDLPGAIPVAGLERGVWAANESRLVVVTGPMIVIINPQTGLVEKRFPCPVPRYVDAVAISPDGSHLLIGSGTNPFGVQIIDIDTAQTTARTPQVGARLYAAEPSPKGDLLAIGVNHTLAILDHQTGTIVRQVHTNNPVIAAAWSPDGSLIAIHVMDFGVDLYRSSTLELLASIKMKEYNRSIAFSSDATFLAAKRTGFITVMRLPQLQSVAEFAITNYDGTDVLWSPKGNQVAGVSPDGRLTCWDVETSRVVWSRPLDRGKVVLAAADWSPDGQWIAITPSKSGTEGIQTTLYHTSDMALSRDCQYEPLDMNLSVGFLPSGDMMTSQFGPHGFSMIRWNTTPKPLARQPNVMAEGFVARSDLSLSLEQWGLWGKTEHNQTSRVVVRRFSDAQPICAIAVLSDDPLRVITFAPDGSVHGQAMDEALFRRVTLQKDGVSSRTMPIR